VFWRDSRSASSLSMSRPRRSSNESWLMLACWVWLAKAWPCGQAELMQLVDGGVMEHGYFLSGQW
jgi:hypothetical protein